MIVLTADVHHGVDLIEVTTSQSTSVGFPSIYESLERLRRAQLGSREKASDWNCLLEERGHSNSS